MAGPIENFAFQLLEGTNNGTITWKTSSDPKVLLLQGNSGLVKLTRLAADTVQLEIFNKDNDQVGSVRSDPSRPGPWEPWETALRELFPSAVLQARGTTEVIHELERELGLAKGGDDDIPF